MGQQHKTTTPYGYLMTTVDYTQSIADNYSKVTVTIQAYSSSTQTTYNSGGRTFTVSLGGKQVSFNWAWSIPAGSNRQITQRVFTIYHTGSGVFPQPTLSIYCDSDSKTFGIINDQWTISIPDIPRKSILKKVPSAVYSDHTSIPFTLDKKYSGFFHIVDFYIGNQWIAKIEGSLGSGEYSIPLSTTAQDNIKKAMPNKARESGLIRVKTYRDSSKSKLIGSSELGTTVIIRQEKERPSVSGGYPTSSTTPCIMGADIRGQFNIQAGLGTSIRSIAISYDGQVQRGKSDYRFKCFHAGTQKVLITVTDARGIQTNAYRTVEVQPYHPPKIYTVYCDRRVPYITQAEVHLQIDISPVKQNANIVNTCSYDIQRKERGQLQWESIFSEAAHTISQERQNSTIYPPVSFPVDKAYDLRIVVSDKWNKAEVQTVLGTGTYPLVLGKTGIGVNCIPSGNYNLESRGNALIEGARLINPYLEGQIKEELKWGQNDNGTYIKLSNGLCFCFGYFPQGEAWTVSWHVWVFPWQFSAHPFGIFTQAMRADGTPVRLNVGAVSERALNVYTNDYKVSFGTYLLAIGFA